MPAKVFISCGQTLDAEKEFAKKLSDWFSAKGFNPYVAIDAQSINDINNSIIWNLRTADFYIFIDLKREQVIPFPGNNNNLRGSLFTHQELAMSYLLKFPEVIFLQHNDLPLEGVLKYILGNPKKFNNYDDAFKIIIDEINTRNWDPEFNRSFRVELLPLTNKLSYKDHSTLDSSGKKVTRESYILKVRVENKRIDLPAINTVARLEVFQDSSGKLHKPDTTSLKWAGEQLYSKPIFETESAEFDAFAIADNNQLEIYLHSARDFYPRLPIINKAGQYSLFYSISAVGFPKCGLKIDIDLTGDYKSTIVSLNEFGHFDVVNKKLLSSSKGISKTVLKPFSNGFSIDADSDGTSSNATTISDLEN